MGDLTWQDEKGELIASMRGVRGEFKTVTQGAPKPSGVDPATYDPALFPEYEELRERIQLAEAFGLKNPYFSVHERICNDTTQVNGKEMINFSSYNYVGNSGDPLVSAAASGGYAVVNALPAALSNGPTSAACVTNPKCSVTLTFPPFSATFLASRST